MMLPYRQLVINCQTNPDVPPPFSHTYAITVDENPAYLVLSFKLTYTDRGELTEDEILEEGFTLDDDFAWSGKLTKTWKQNLDALITATKFHQNASQGSDYAIRIVSKHDGEESSGFVAKKETLGWVYFIQELRQAILESEGIEAPLTIEYLRIDGKSETNVVLNGSFSERVFTVRVNDRPVEQFDWPVLQRVINLIFNETEIDPEEGINTKPSQNGHYLLLPGTGWLLLETGIRARYDDIAILENIINTMDRFIDGK